MNFKQFGGKASQEDLKRYQQSPNWKDGAFQNLEETNMNEGIWKLPSIIYKQLTQGSGKFPKRPIPVVPFDLDAFMAPSEETKFIWYGHSVLLMRMNDKTILIDPMLGPDTTPIAPVANKRFSDDTLALIDDFPIIDLVLFTHDHYDHLDFASVQKLNGKVKQFFVALGLKRHLVSWGIPSELITEMDWWDNKTFQDVSITFTPTRHFSGRGLTDRQKCLWGGWAFKTTNENIWFSGDGGYGKHFKAIGEKLGPFDFAFMECGQYNDDWHLIHLFPEEAIQAAIDAKAIKIMPVHCAGFALSYQHTWSEPLVAFKKFAQQKEVAFSMPKIGQLFTKSFLGEEAWWETI